MVQGKRIPLPQIVLVSEEPLLYPTKEEAWKAIGPILTRILVKTVVEEMNLKREDSKKSSDHD